MTALLADRAGLTVSAGRGGTAHPSPILPLWQEMIIGAIAFGVLCFVLMKYVFPRMEQMFQARVEAIEGGIERAEEAQAEANELLEQYKPQLAEARTEAARIRDEARGRRRGHPAGRARQGARGVRPHHRGRPGAAHGRAADASCASCGPRSGTLAVDLAGRIVGESLADEARRRGTVERFLADLDAAGGGSGADGGGEPGVVRRRGRAAGGLRHGRASGAPGRRWPTRSSRWRAAGARAAAAPGAVRPGPARRRPGRAARIAARRQGLGRHGRTCSRTLVAGRWSARQRAARRDRAARRRRAARQRRRGRASWPRSRTSCSASGRSWTRLPAAGSAVGDGTAARGAAGRARRTTLLEGKAKPVTVRLVELALRGLRRPQLRQLADPAGRAGRASAATARSRT